MGGVTIEIVRESIALARVRELAAEQFGDMVKAGDLTRDAISRVVEQLVVADG